MELGFAVSGLAEASELAALRVGPQDAAVPGVEDDAVEHMRALEHQLTFKSGSRMVKEATIAIISALR